MTERLIDANALIRCIDEKIGEGWHSCSLAINMGYIDGMADAIYAIDDQPTVDAEQVRHGMWKEDKMKMIDGKISISIPYYLCSECGGYMDADTTVFKYCPYCGAKMDEQEKEDDKKID